MGTAPSEWPLQSSGDNFSQIVQSAGEDVPQIVADPKTQTAGVLPADSHSKLAQPSSLSKTFLMPILDNED
ncbi:MAG: hypothetical protein ACR2FS_03600, partial [Phormidesmis sp.]